jgi:hypothetical protein
VTGKSGRSCAEKNPSGVIIVDAQRTPVFSAKSRVA